MKKKRCYVTLSDTDDAGEGEHKIIRFINEMYQYDKSTYGKMQAD